MSYFFGIYPYILIPYVGGANVPIPIPIPIPPNGGAYDANPYIGGGGNFDIFDSGGGILSY